MTKGSKSELEFGDEAGVAEESFIENLVDGGAVVPARCGSRTTRVRALEWDCWSLNCWTWN